MSKHRTHQVPFPTIVRLLAGMLCLCLAWSGAGCAAQPPVSSPSTSGTPSAGTVEESLPYRELNLYMPGSIERDQQLVEDAINEELLASLRCKLDIRITEWNLWASRYPILLSSGEPIDLMFSASYFGYLQEVSRQSFLPLDELLSAYGQGVKGVMLDGYLDAARVHGVLYAIPVNKDTGQGWGLVANREMMQGLGLDLASVHTLEDLEPILAKAKARLPETVTPLFLSPDLSMFQILGATEDSARIGLKDRSQYVQLGDGLFYDMVRRKALPSYDIPAVEAQCRTARDWFQAGYINPDVATTQRTSRQAMQDGDVLMHVQAQTPVHLNQWQNETGRELQSVELVGSVKETQSMTGALVVLPVGCADPERAMMVINAFWTDAALKNLYTWGIEGRHYVRDHENIIRLPSGVASADASGYNPGNFWQFGNAYLLDVWESEHPQKWEQLRAYCENMPKSPLLGFSFDATTVRRELGAYASDYAELAPLLVNGVMDTDEMLRKMRQLDQQNGLPLVLREIERQVDAWLLEKP